MKTSFIHFSDIGYALRIGIWLRVGRSLHPWVSCSLFNFWFPNCWSGSSSVLIYSFSSNNLSSKTLYAVGVPGPVHKLVPRPGIYIINPALTTVADCSYIELLICSRKVIGGTQVIFVIAFRNIVVDIKT